MRRLLLFVAAILIAMPMAAKEKKKDAQEAEGYKFTDVKINPATSVKDQASSGTCWSYSGLAFIESELIRKGKGEHDLAEMWIVRHTYLNKAKKYARMHGSANLSAGGATHDNFDVIQEYGIVPQEVYQGLNYGTDKNVHGELDNTIKAYMDAIIKRPNGKSLSTAWVAGLNGILDAYLGEVPEKFTYQGKEYTPKSFAEELGLDKKDYISITSFTDKPLHSWFAVEVPDNFAWGLSYNVTLDEMMQAIDAAIENGETVLWASDVSEMGFQYRRGFAVLPDFKTDDMTGSEKAKWVKMDEKQRLDSLFSKPVAELKVTPELRQQWYDNYETTDDHGMQIVGVAKDQNGTKYYKVKNSWTDDGIYGGYFYASEEFVKGKTMNIIVAADSVPFTIK